MRHVIGIDAGGTKTVCLLADESGNILVETRGPGANLKAAGEASVESTLRQVIGEALASGLFHVDVIAIGMAGVDREDERATLTRVLTRIGLPARTLFVNDALIALVAGAGAGAGVVLIAGTGSIAYGRDERGRAARSGGWGYVLGDEGSGYWIGRRALRAVVREADGRGPATVLTPRLLRTFSVARAQDLVRIVYDRNMKPSEIAALAPHAQEAAREGDVVAAAILNDAADELLSATAAVIRQLDLEPEPFTLVLAGGMFKAIPWLATELPPRVATLAPRATSVHLRAEPATGAVRLALEELRGGAILPRYA